MKLAEEWIKEDMPSLPDVAIQPYAKWVRAIQLDAWKQGMADAAEIVDGRKQMYSEGGEIGHAFSKTISSIEAAVDWKEEI